MQMTLVLLIVLAATLYAIRNLRRSIKHDGCASGCGSCSSHSNSNSNSCSCGSHAHRH